jgi:hexosaminidase
MKKLDTLFLYLFLLPLVRLTSAQASGLENQLKLIPAPKEVSIQPGSFRVRPSTRIFVEFGHQAEDRIAAETLAEEIHDQAGFRLSITGAKPDSRHESKEETRNIVLARLQDRKVRDFLASKELKADSIGDQGYLLFSDKSHLIVAANTGQGLFYGVQTLRQLLRSEGRRLICPAVLIRDWPSMEGHGVQDNISRGPIPTEDSLSTWSMSSISPASPWSARELPR